MNTVAVSGSASGTTAQEPTWWVAKVGCEEYRFWKCGCCNQNVRAERVVRLLPSHWQAWEAVNEKFEKLSRLGGMLLGLLVCFAIAVALGVGIRYIKDPFAGLIVTILAIIVFGCGYLWVKTKRDDQQVNAANLEHEAILANYGLSLSDVQRTGPPWKDPKFIVLPMGVMNNFQMPRR
jgi:hypothetical protein